MISELLDELKHNRKINLQNGIENRVDIDYIIERLENISNNMNNYRAIEIRDCVESSICYETIMLNKKHSVKDLQDEIYRIKKDKYDEIMKYGNDLEIIKENISDEFDWFELETDCYDYNYVEV